MSELHLVYACWIRLKAGFWCNDEFVANSCPLPKSTGNHLMFEGMLMPMILHKLSHVQDFRMLKQEIDRHIKTKISRKVPFATTHEKGRFRPKYYWKRTKQSSRPPHQAV